MALLAASVLLIRSVPQLRIRGYLRLACILSLIIAP